MIAYNTSDGVAIVIPTGEIPLQQVIEKDVPTSDYVIVECIPVDRIFRGAWVINENIVIEDLEQSRQISHQIRRARRDAEFLPLDRLVTVPSQQEYAEAQREIIRNKYNIMQEQIDNCITTQQLKEILEE